MTLTIDLGEDIPRPKGWDVDTTQRIHFSDYTRADRTARQIIEAIEGIEDPALVSDYIAAESLVIDALYLSNWPHMAADIEAAAEEQRALLGACPTRRNREQPGAPVIAQSQKETKMFIIDTGDNGGSMGPWVSWSSNGSAEKGFPPRSWVLRERDENSGKVETVIPAFSAGCVVDLDSLQLGWEKDGAMGMAPERRWNPSVSQSTPRPDDSKKASGAYAWSRALSVRIAIGGGRAATWEQGSFGAYEAFSRVAKKIMAEHPGDNSLPLIKQVGVETIKLPSGTANVPLLEIAKWVPRPDCLKTDAPKIDTGQAQPQPAQPAQPAKPAVQPAPAPVDEEMDF